MFTAQSPVDYSVELYVSHPKIKFGQIYSRQLTSLVR